MNRISSILCLFLFLPLHEVCAQMSLLSQKNMGGSSTDSGTTVYPTPDNTGYYIMGYSYSDSSDDKSENSRGNADLWIVKTDLDFNIEWDKTIGGNQSDLLMGCVITDTVIYCLLTTYSTVSFEKTAPNRGGISDIWLLKLDLNGTILNQQTYGGSQTDTAKKLLKRGNNLLIVGESNSPVSGNKTVASKGDYDYWLLEIDPTNLSVMNERVIGSSTQDYCMDATITNDQSLYIMGYSQTGTSADKTDNGYGDLDVWMVKMDAELNIVMDKCFGGTSAEGLYAGGALLNDGTSIYLTTSSYSTISGNKTSINHGSDNGSSKDDIWLLKLDSDMNIIWDRSYGGTNFDAPVSFSLLGNTLAIGSNSQSAQGTGNKTAPYYGFLDAWMIFVDLSGQEVTQYTLGSQGDDSGGIQLQRGDTLIFVGETDGSVSGNQTTGSNGSFDFWIATLKIPGLAIQNPEQEQVKLRVYPNPFNQQLIFENEKINNEPKIITIFSADGKKLEELIISAGASSVTWNPDLKSGIYYYTCDGQSGKVVYQK